MIQSPELQSRIALWRMKIAEGTITKEEMQQAVAALREGRLSAAASASSTRRAKAKAEIPSAADLLGELDAL